MTTSVEVADNAVEKNQPPDRLIIAIVFVAFIAICSIYAPWLIGRRDFVQGDLLYYYQPTFRYIGDSLSQGRLPLWNPYIYCGMPQIAVSSPGLFYPFNYLVVALPFSLGLALYFLCHHCLGALGSYLYLRMCGLVKSAAFFAALCMLFLGSMFAAHKLPDYAANIAWIPWCLYACCRTCQSRRGQQRIGLALLSVATALLVLAGRPEIFLPGLSLMALQIAVCCVRGQEAKEQKLKAAGLSVTAALIGILFACPALLPTLEWFRLSHRFGGLSASEVFAHSARWSDWLSMVCWQPLPNLMAESPIVTKLRQVIEGGNTVPFLPAVFLGPGLITLAFIAATQKRSHAALVLLAIAVAFAVLAAGDCTAAGPLLLKLMPSLAVLRYPVKLIVFPCLCVVFLAGLGMHSLWQKSCARWVLITAGVTWACVFLAGVFPMAPHAVLDWICTSGIAHGVIFSGAETGELLQILARSFVVSGLLGLATTSICLLFQRRVIASALAYVALIAVTIVPLSVYGYLPRNDSTRFGIYQKPQSLALLLNGQSGAVPLSALRTVYDLNLWLPQVPPFYTDLEKQTDYDATTLYFWDIMVPNTNFGIRQYSSGYGHPETRYMDALLGKAQWRSTQNPVVHQAVSDIPLARFCSLTNSGLVVTDTDDYIRHKPAPLLDSALFTLLKEDHRMCIRIYKTNAIPKRFYFATMCKAVNSWDELVDALSSPYPPNPVDENITFFLSGQGPFAPARRVDENTRTEKSVPGSNFDAPITVEDDKPELIRLRVQKQLPGILIVRDQFYPGWVATVDGRAESILCANLFNRAIAVPSGKHEIVLRYAPLSLAYGFVAAACGLILLIVLMIRGKDQQS